MEKTLAQYQKEEADRLEEARKREQKETDARQQGFFDRIINGLWNLIPDFSLENILIGLAIAVGGYFLVRSEQGQQFMKDHFSPDMRVKVNGIASMIGGFFGAHGVMDVGATLLDMPIEDARATLIKNGVSREVAGVIANRDLTLRAFVSHAQQANDGKSGLSELTNDKTLYALMTREPEFTRDIAKAAFASGAKDGATTGQLSESLKAIISDPARLTALATTHRNNTIKLLKAVGGENVDEKQIARLLQAGVTDGKANGFLRDTLLAMMTPGTDGKLPAPETAVIAAAAKNPQSARVLMDQYIDQLPEPQGKLVRNLRQVLGEDATAEFMQVASAGGDKMKMILAFAAKHPHALPHLLDVAAASPELMAQAGALPVSVTSLKQFVDVTGYTNGRPNNAAVQLLATLSRPDQKLTADGLLEPVTAYMLSPEVANNPRAVAAIKTLLGSIDTNALNVEQREQITTLQTMLTPQRLQALSAIKQNGVDPFALVKKFQTADAKGVPQFSADNAIKVLLDPKKRADVERADTTHIAALVQGEVPLLSKGNLDQFLAFGKAIGDNAANQENPARTNKVMGIAGSIHGGKSLQEALGDVNAKDISGFFQIPENREAFKAVLARTDVSSLPVNQQTLIKGLSGLMDGKDGGLGQTLANEHDVAFLLSNVKAGPSPHASNLVTSDWAQDLYLKHIRNVSTPETVRALGALIQKSVPEGAVVAPPQAKSGFGLGFSWR